MHDEQVIQHTQPYPDVIEVLKQLCSKNIPMAVATNKRFTPTQKLIDHFGWNNYFNFIECSDSHSKVRNKDEMIQKITNQDESFKRAYFVGDTVNDGLSANLNQLKFIKASYGYGRMQDWGNVLIHKNIFFFSELLDII
jgi:phosphoglycolate phosphatase